LITVSGFTTLRRPIDSVAVWVKEKVTVSILPRGPSANPLESYLRQLGYWTG
jgi:hypothetical protein